MSTADIASDLPESHVIPRQWIVVGGRVLLGLALLVAWEWGARSFGMLFFAPPFATLQRIVEMAANGKLLTDIIATLRVSALGFVIGCACGIGLPFLLRLSPRLTQAIEPFILASMGIPKYALTPWLILWFGIGDRPKVIVVTLFVFYIVFITVFAGMRGVDPRLINMARVVGASERAIAAKVIWVSLLPFFFHRAEGGAAARGERRDCRRVSGGDRGHRLFDRACPAAFRYDRGVRRHCRRGGAGAADQRHRQCAGTPCAEMAAGRPRYADLGDGT